VTALYQKLPKIHKKNVPYRIIISSIGTLLCPLRIFLHDPIAKNISLSTSYVNNSFDLYKYLLNIKIPHSYGLISLDVFSLFINVSLNLAIDGIRKRWVYISKSTNLSQNEFLTALKKLIGNSYQIHLVV